VPTPYTPTANWTATVDLPDDGDDARDISTVDVPLEAALDRTEYLKEHGLVNTIFHNETSLSTPFSTTSATFVDVTAFFASVPNCRVGDVLMVTMTAQLTVGTAGANGTFEPVVTDGGVDHAQLQIIFGQDVASFAFGPPYTMHFKYIVLVAGTVDVKAMVKNDGTHISNVAAPALISILHVRP
jgi:hypothetical protein